MYAIRSYYEILSPKRIEIDYLEDSLVIRKNTVRYKLKDDGFVRNNFV